MASESLADLLAKGADATIHAALQSGVLDGIPVIGALNNSIKAVNHVREVLFLRKVALFLQQFAQVSFADRAEFVAGFSNEAEQERFGEGLLLLLDRAEDMQKPKIIGRIIAALARGNIPFAKAMRLASMVDRSYTGDLSYLPSFCEGPQSESLAPIAESLFAAGFVSNCGFDGGDGEGNSGVIYAVNEYGKLLLRFGLGET